MQPIGPPRSRGQPSSADGGERRDDREGQRHAREQRERAAREAAVGTAKTNGRTGRMQGLTMVSMPPTKREAQSASLLWAVKLA